VWGRGFAPSTPGSKALPCTIGKRLRAEAARHLHTDIFCHFRYARQGKGAGVSYASCI